jgi:hypothetical protein
MPRFGCLGVYSVRTGKVDHGLLASGSCGFGRACTTSSCGAWPQTSSIFHGHGDFRFCLPPLGSHDARSSWRRDLETRRGTNRRVRTNGRLAGAGSRRQGCGGPRVRPVDGRYLLHALRVLGLASNFRQAALRHARDGRRAKANKRPAGTRPLVLEILLGVFLDQRREPSHYPVYEREEGLARLRGKNVGREGTTGARRLARNLAHHRRLRYSLRLAAGNICRNSLAPLNTVL